VAIADRVKNNQDRIGNRSKSVVREVVSAIPQVITTIMEVRIAVARFELIETTPIFANTAVNPANSADRRAQKSHMVRSER